ncbi:hypothetical protein BDV93DRAFT_609830 [Ceratobasidium sp. AG-I]|nr:hypothetical protein BDV93DRAFT_609830 [Ceratobasidium sp. AG-I]
MIDLACQLKPTFSGFELGNLYNGPRPATVTLSRRIYGGPRRWSQVYQVAVDSWDRPVSELKLPAHFVLKLYVASELTSLEDWDTYGLDHLGPNAEEEQREMIEQETRAYEKLIGCPVTPRWFGTYQFTLPSKETCMGTLLEYIDGESLSCHYVLDRNQDILPFAERMVTAAEALDQLHSRGVRHGDIREPNIILLPSPQERFPLRFVDFGASAVYESDELTEESAQLKLRDDTSSLMKLLIGYFGLSPASSRPPLRAIPRQGAIVKFLEAWNTRATYEEQVEALVAEIMARGVTDEAMLLKLENYRTENLGRAGELRTDYW